MDNILTPELAEMWKDHYLNWSCNPCNITVRYLFDNYTNALHTIEALREQLAARTAERDSWKATAEEAMDKNVNRGLLQRHEMREAALREQLVEARAACTAASQSRANVVIALQEAEANMRALLEIRCIHPTSLAWKKTPEVLARPGMKQMMEEKDAKP